MTPDGRFLLLNVSLSGMERIPRPFRAVAGKLPDILVHRLRQPYDRRLLYERPGQLRARLLQPSVTADIGHLCVLLLAPDGHAVAQTIMLTHEKLVRTYLYRW